MANESKVLVRLRLLGADLMARDANKASSGLKEIDRSARRASGGLNSVKGGKIKSELSLVDRSSVKLKSSLKGINTGAAAATKALGLVSAAAAGAAAAGLAKAIKTSVDFEQSMANVQAKLLVTGKDMQPLNKLAIDLGAKTSFSASQAAGAMDELAASGMGVGRIMKVLPGTLSLAAATGTDLSQAAQIQTTTLNGFALGAGQANRVADVLAQTANRSAAGIDDMQLSLKYIAPVAKMSGQSLEDMMTSVGLMANVGIKGEQAGTTLRGALIRLTKPTDKARTALSTLGLKAGDLVGKKGLLSMPNIMGKVVKGSQGLSKNTRNTALATIFGTEALSGMSAMVEAGPKKFAKMNKALDNSRGAAKRSADIMRGTVKGAWDNFTGSIDSASISLLTRFNPAIRNALGAASKTVTNVTKKFNDFWAGVSGAQPTRRRTRATQGLPSGGGGALRTEQTNVNASQSAGAKVRSVAQTAIGWVQAQLPKVGAVVLSVGKQLLDAFKPMAPFLSNVMLPLLKGIAMGVMGAVVGAFKVAVPIIKVLATVLGWVGTKAAPFKGIIEKVGMVIGFLAAGPILKLLGGLKYLGVVFRIAAVPIRVLAGLGRGLVSVLSIGARVVVGYVRLWIRVGQAFVRAADTVRRFLGMGGKLGRTVANWMGSIMNKVGALPGRIAGAVKGVGGKLISGIANSVRSKLGSLVSFFGRVGSRIVSTMVGAFRKAPGLIMNAIGSMVDAMPIPGIVKGKIKDFIGAHAGGGVVRTPLQVVGENGPELAALPLGSRVTPAGPTRRMMSPSGASPAPMLSMPSSGPLYAQLVVNLDGRAVHEGVHKVERRLEEAR